MRRLVRAGLLIGPLAAALALPSESDSQTFVPIPSQRYEFISAPILPKSFDQCTAMGNEFAEEIRKLSEAHDKCLEGAPHKELPTAGATCSRPQCQPLHTARDLATRRANDQGKLCQERVGRYIDAERRAHELDADRKRREQDRELASRKRDQDRIALSNRRNDVLAPESEREEVEVPQALRDAQQRLRDPGPWPNSTSDPIPPRTPPQAVIEPSPRRTVLVGPAVKQWDRLSDEQKDAVESTGISGLLNLLAKVSVKSVPRAIANAVGNAGTNPVLELSQPFLDVENYAKIKMAVEAAFREQETGSGNNREARALRELQRQQKSEGRRDRPTPTP